MLNAGVGEQQLNNILAGMNIPPINHNKTQNMLSSKTINYLKKNFTYAISQNKNDVNGLKQNINAIVPHAFGKHELCRRSWCKFYTDKDYRPPSLPFGKYLDDLNLETALTGLFSQYTTDTMVTKLSHMESTNANENMNQVISRKAPKASHFSGSESLDYRVAAAVAQKNEGHAYILQVRISQFCKFIK